MGVMARWMNGSLSQGGSQAVESNQILRAVADQIDPTTKIDWTAKSPTVHKMPKGATVQQADAVEREANLFEIAVGEAKRIHRAETRKQVANAELIKSHRTYLGDTAAAHLDAASANKNLASRLQGMRRTYASLGMGLERTVDRANQAIDVTATKYGAIKA